MSSDDAATQDVWRLFVAVDLPDDVKRRLQEIRSTLQQAGWKARWTKPETMHLTLKFFGNQPVGSIHDLTDGLRSTVEHEVSFDLRTGEMGAFPNVRRPRVVWLGVMDRIGTLSRVASNIEERSRELGQEPEERPFSPHLTVARIRPEDRATIVEIERQFRGLNLLPQLRFEVDHITLYRSELRRPGAIYTALERIDFEGER